MDAPVLCQSGPLRKIHRKLTFAKPVPNRLPSTVSGTQAPPKIAVIEGDRASQALLKHVFEIHPFLRISDFCRIPAFLCL